jgi:chloramphenicol O-acetyltransferase
MTEYISKINELNTTMTKEKEIFNLIEHENTQFKEFIEQFLTDVENQKEKISIFN